MMKAAESGILPPSEREVRAADAKALAAALPKWVRGRQGGGLPGHPRLPRADPAQDGGAARPPGRAAREDPARRDPRLRPPLPALDGAAPQGGHRTAAASCSSSTSPRRIWPVPETNYTFGTLIRAQAEGDRQALEQRGRQVLRVQLGHDDDRGAPPP